MMEGEQIWECQYVVKGGMNLPILVGIGLTDLSKMGGRKWPPAPRFRHHCIVVLCLIDCYVLTFKYFSMKEL